MTREQHVARTIGGLAGLVGLGVMLMTMTIPLSAAGAAQGPPRAGRPGPGGDFGGGPGLGGPFGGGGLNLPGLTDAQRDQIRAVMEQHRDELRKLTGQLMMAQRGLEASVAQGQVDESKAADIGASATALALARARVETEVRALLTPEQRQQIEARRQEMRTWLESRPGGQGRGPGRPGGPGGRRGR